MKKNAFIMPTIAAATLFGFVVATDTFAADAGVQLNVSSSISVALSTDSVELEITPTSQGVFDSDHFSASVSTNNPTGYTLMMTSNHSYLESNVVDPGTGETAKIDTLNYVQGGISEDAFRNGSTAGILNRWGISIDGNNNYNEVGTSSSIKITDDEAEGDITNIYVATKLNSTVIPTTYSTTLRFSAVANVVEPDEGTEFLCTDTTCTEDPTDPSVPSTHLDGKKNVVTFEGGSIERVFEVEYVTRNISMYIPVRNTETGEYTGEYKQAKIGREYSGISADDYRFAMQDMTPQMCAKITKNGSSLRMVDIRDGKSYWVSKLKDGHCWMTQDLDLDLSTKKTFSSLDTDLTFYGEKGYTDNNYYSKEGNIIYWTPARNTLTELTDSGYIAGEVNYTSTASAVSFDPGIVYQVNDYFSPTECNYFVGLTKCKNYFVGTSQGNEHRRIGNYYSWSAAVANNLTFFYDDNTSSDVTNNPQNSICPAGWRLPTISSEEASTVGSTNEFERLGYLYLSKNQNADYTYSTAPLFFNRSGLIEHGQDSSITDSTLTTGANTLYNGGSWFSYWSSTIKDSTNAYAFNKATITYEYEKSDYKAYMLNVRCVAR